MSLAEFLNAAADAVLAMEPDPYFDHIYPDSVYMALAEAQQHAAEAQQS